jgi:hypothetical protein
MKLPHRALLLSAALSVIVGSAGCNYSVLVPPGRIATHSVVHTLPPGQSTVEAAAQFGATVFDPSIAAGELAYHAGLTDEMQLEGTGTAMVVLKDSALNPTVGMGRLGVKYNPRHNRFVSFSLGGAAIYSPAAGSAFGVDGAINLGWRHDMCGTVPFFNLRGSIMGPVQPRTVDFGDGELSRTATTVGMGVTAGVRFSDHAARCRQSGGRSNAFYIATALDRLQRIEGRRTGGGYLSLSVGFEFPL